MAPYPIEDLPGYEEVTKEDSDVAIFIRSANSSDQSKWFTHLKRNIPEEPRVKWYAINQANDMEDELIELLEKELKVPYGTTLVFKNGEIVERRKLGDCDGLLD